jgi:hypothetical protein
MFFEPSNGFGEYLVHATLPSPEEEITVLNALSTIS